MTLSKLTTALTAIFIISALVLIGELLLLLLRRRRSLRHQQPVSGDHLHPHLSPTSYHPPHNPLYFLCFKSHTRVDPSGAPTENSDGTSPEDPVIDVFKLLEANGPSRFLCTIKEDDSECVESTSLSGGGSGEVTEKVSLKACLEAEAAEEKASKVNVVVDDATTTVVSSPCDSPVFFTPVGSPLRDGGV